MKTPEPGGSFQRRLKEAPALLLDSAMGTQLEARGIDCRLPLWSARALVENPREVFSIHLENVAAGADILTGNTFRTHSRTLAKEDLAQRAEELTRLAVELAREAAQDCARKVFVAGSLAPLEDCYRPDLVPPAEELVPEHRRQARALGESGVDLLLLETHNTVKELCAALEAAKETGLPVIASVVTDGKGRLLSGEPIEEAAGAMLAHSADVLSINCVAAADLLPDLRRLAAAAPGALLGAYGNATRFAGELSPDAYADVARSWLDLGVRVVGGCCGTTPGHTRALRRLLDGTD